MTTTGKWAPSIYFVLGQVAWFACVVSAAEGMAFIGVAVTILLVAVHVALAARPREELKLVVSVAVIGCAWETALIHIGLLSYPKSHGILGLAPFWLSALWSSFAAQFNTTYRWLKPRMAVAAILGAIAGPLSFRAGASLGALRFEKPWPAACALALGWAVLLPLVVGLSRHWDGVRER